jgi:hypothetical protein
MLLELPFPLFHHVQVGAENEPQKQDAQPYELLFSESVTDRSCPCIFSRRACLSSARASFSHFSVCPLYSY